MNLWCMSGHNDERLSLPRDSADESFARIGWNTSSGQVAATNAYQFLFDFVKCVQVGSGCSRFQDDCAGK